LIGCKSGGEGTIHPGMGEVEACGGEPGGICANTCKESLVGHGTEGQMESGGGGGNEGRAMDGCSEEAGEVGIRDGLGSRNVQGASEGWGLKGEKDGRDSVNERDPAHPLVAGTERASKAEAKQRKKPRESAGTGAEHNPETEMDDANSGIGGGLGGGFPLAAKIRQKAGAVCGSLVEQLVAAVAVDAGSRGR